MSLCLQNMQNDININKHVFEDIMKYLYQHENAGQYEIKEKEMDSLKMRRLCLPEFMHTFYHDFLRIIS